MTTSSFLGLEGLHVFITGGAGGIGSEAVREFLSHGCRVTAHDLRPIDKSIYNLTPDQASRLYTVNGDISLEPSISAGITSALSHFGPINVLVANAGITNESAHPPIWELTVDTWDQVSGTNVRGTFLTIKHFLLAAKKSQENASKELDNLAIVVTGSECGKFGQEGHAEYGTGKAGLQYGLVRTVKNEIVRLNSHARINAVAPGWVNTELIGDRLDDRIELWAESQATVALKKIAQPSDVARAMAFLASHKAAGHISGHCLSIDGGMEGRLIWRDPPALDVKEPGAAVLAGPSIQPISLSLPAIRKCRLRIALSVDFDALSGFLGTGQNPANTMSDYSSGLLSARIGVPRLLRLFKKYGISEKVTWFMPGHSIESFPKATADIVASGCEIGLHGYSHEGAYQMNEKQERDVLVKCIEIVKNLKGGKRPVGYRAPLYQIRESTLKLLEEYGFEYDSSMNAHDSLPYALPNPIPDPPHVPDWTKDAETWMHPLPEPAPPSSKSLIEIPTSWYTEDMTPLGFYPYTPNSQGYVPTDAVEKMWYDRFEWLWENESDIEGDDVSENQYGSIFPMIFHPESSGRAHIIGMVERFIKKLTEMTKQHDGITFETMADIASDWKIAAKLQ